MSKVEELLAKYNSNGISTIKLADILDYEQPSKYIVSSSEYDDNYDIPVLTAGQSFILGYTDEKDGVYKASKNNPTIIFDDFTTGHHWVDFDFKIKSSAMKMLRLKNNKSLLRYIFHSMALINYVPTEHSRQWISKYSQFEIPIPHIKVQEEIVKILDSFTNLIDALNEELSLRQKQFEYYREKLLTFDDKSLLKPINEIGTLFRGNGLQKKDFVDEGVGCIHYGQIYTKLGFSLSKPLTYVTKETAKPLTKVRKGDLVIACTSENIEDVCKSVVWEGEEEIVTGGHACVLRHNENPRYIGYFFQTHQFFMQKKQYAYGAKVIDIKTEKLGEILIPVPSLAIQLSIVEKLDAFESLISSLKEEIALRQKQYEYYREKLLTFD